MAKLVTFDGDNTVLIDGQRPEFELQTTTDESGKLVFNAVPKNYAAYITAADDPWAEFDAVG